MLCAIYKSKKKEGMYLYVAKRDQFDMVPQVLRELFGTPIFVMLFNLKGQKALRQADNEEVMQKIEQQGFYLQMPQQEENLLELHKKSAVK
ncbi:YcgL domain-containing protein [Pasteurellaceae bacterium 22721_9_1]